MTVAQWLMDRGRRASPEARPEMAPTAHAASKYDLSVNADALGGPGGPVDPARALSALQAIPADLERDQWLRVVMAAHAAGVAEGDYLSWCRTGGDKFTTDADAMTAWNSYHPARPGGIMAATLFHVARRHGWVQPGLSVLAQAANDQQQDDDQRAQPTDLWLAKYFKRQCSADYRFDHSSKKWRNYRAGSWAPCRKDEHVEAMKRLAGLLMERAGAMLKTDPENPKSKKLLACARRAQSVQGIEAALKLAQSDPGLAISAEELDTDSDLFNAANGVVELPTGALLAHDPAQMLYRQSPVPYDVDAACPQFLAFMDQISCNDPAWVESMQRELGYSLSGHVSEEKLFFWLGRGANGKSVLANILRYILGNYAATVPPAFMMQSKRDGGGATPELAMLAGARSALANEVEAGSRLSAQMVKVAVSTEHITARPLYGAPFTFQPTHKLLIRGNHRPIITDEDEGIWRRILLVPFDLDVAAADRDPGLEARLVTEAPGILRWLVEGFAKWRLDGLKPCKRMTDASLAYRKESDLLMVWVAEQCDVGPGLSVDQRTAYAHYRHWRNEQGLGQHSKASFTRGLTGHGFGESREGGGTRQHTYTGLRMRTV